MVHGEVDLGGELETNSGLPGGSCSSLDVSSTISLLAEGSELAILSPSFPFMNASRLAGKRMSFTLMIRQSNMEKDRNLNFPIENWLHLFDGKFLKSLSLCSG